MCSHACSPQAYMHTECHKSQCLQVPDRAANEAYINWFTCTSSQDLLTGSSQSLTGIAVMQHHDISNLGLCRSLYSESVILVHKQHWMLPAYYSRCLVVAFKLFNVTSLARAPGTGPLMSESK